MTQTSRLIILITINLLPDREIGLFQAIVPVNRVYGCEAVNL